VTLWIYAKFSEQTIINSIAALKIEIFENTPVHFVSEDIIGVERSGASWANITAQNISVC